MPPYYVTTKKDDKGYNEVHVMGCGGFPELINIYYLGNYPTCEAAMEEAKRKGYKTLMAVLVVQRLAIQDEKTTEGLATDNRPLNNFPFKGTLCLLIPPLLFPRPCFFFYFCPLLLFHYSFGFF